MDKYNWHAISFAFSAVQTLVFAIVGLYLYITRNNQLTKADAEQRIEKTRKETDKKIESVCEDLKVTGGRVDLHSDRISVLEENVRCAPSHEDLGNLHTRINDVAGTVNEMNGTMKGMNRNVDLIHKYLLENGKGKEQ